MHNVITFETNANPIYKASRTHTHPVSVVVTRAASLTLSQGRERAASVDNRIT